MSALCQTRNFLNRIVVLTPHPSANLAMGECEAMQTRRDFLLTSVSMAAVATWLPPMDMLANAAALPAMPPSNPWLAESVYPTSHFNPGSLLVPHTVARAD